MKRAAIYTRTSTGDQNANTQLYDLRALATQRGLEIVREYNDTVSGAKAKRPGLDELMTDARRGRFDIVLVWAFDRLARSVRHFLEVVDEFNHLGIAFISFRETVDSSGPLGRALIVILGAIAELERNLIIERVKAGMRRAKLEGRRVGRQPLLVNTAAIRRDRVAGKSLQQIARACGISKSSVARITKGIRPGVSEGEPQLALQGVGPVGPGFAA